MLTGPTLIMDVYAYFSTLKLCSLILDFRVLSEKTTRQTKTLHKYCGMSCRPSGAQVMRMPCEMWGYVHGKGGRFQGAKAHQNTEITENRARICLRCL